MDFCDLVINLLVLLDQEVWIQSKFLLLFFEKVDSLYLESRM